MPMQMTFRWYGQGNDKITLSDIKQIPGVEGIVWALHDKMPGEIWQPEEIEKIERIANNVGVAFQIQDDILDVTSSVEVLGKPIGSDEKNDKTTYVTLVGIDKAREFVQELSVEAVTLLESFDMKDNFLKELLLSLINRKK